MDLDDTAQYEEFLKCAICLDVLQDEKMLPCSHMFCLECLEGYCGKFSRDVTCPECRMTHQIPSGGVRKFPKNIRLRQFLDKLCPICSKNPKTVKCGHCGEMVCAKCHDSHIAKLRNEVGEKIGLVEGVDEGKIAKEVKREKKVLKDKEKLMDRDLSRAAEDLIKIIRNREKKLKTDLKNIFKAENDKLDQQLKKYQESVSSLKAFGKKSDLAKLPVNKLKDMKENWPKWEGMLTEMKDGLNIQSCSTQHEIGTSEIGIAIKRNWNVLTEDDISDTSSVISDLEPPSPRSPRASMIAPPTCVIGTKGYIVGKLNSPFRVGISPNTKHVIAVDTQNDRVQMFDMSGQYVSSFGAKGHRHGDFNHPIGLFVTKEGQYFIADTKNHRIEVFDGDRYLRSFGKEGNGPGEYCQPWDITMDSHKLLYITDCANNRVQVVTTDGRHVRTVGEHKLSNPTGIAVDKHGEIYVADCENHRILVFSKSGQLKQTIGKEGQRPGELSYPDGIVLDSQENIVVAEWGNHRIQVFSKAGKSLRVLGSHGSGLGEFQQPRGVTIADGRIVVSDCGNNRIQIF